MPNRRARFKRHYIGVRPWTRHSLVLIVAGLVYISIGIVYVKTPDGGPTWEALAIARNWIDLDDWAVAWIFVGCISIVSARWPPLFETWGYTALTALATLWGFYYVMGVIFGESSVGTAAVGLVWWLVAFMWWAISGLLSPQKVGGSDGRG